MQSRFIFLLLYNYGKAAQNNEVILSGEQTQKLLIHLRHRMPFVSEETRRRQGRRRMETLPASVRYGPGTHLLWLRTACCVPGVGSLPLLCSETYVGAR